MRYKAIMFDVDGTLLPYDYYALPSNAVTQAIKKAQKYVTVSLVTGRSYGFLKEILKKLDLYTGYAVVNNGAQVIDLANGSIVYDQPIERQDAQEIISFLHQENIPFYLKQNHDENPSAMQTFQNGQDFKNAYMFFTDEILSEEKANSVINTLSHLSNITIYKSRHKHPDKYGLNISHAKATKLHGIYEIGKRINVHPHEMIGVGDSYNDFPLLMACGLKVAMGNAIDDLKAIADYIAPSVTEDGAATVIEKFILAAS